MTTDLESTEAALDATIEEASYDTTSALSFSVKKFVLQTALESALPVLPSKDIIPVLKHFHVTVAPDLLRVAATDSELTMIVEHLMVDTVQAGSAVFPGKQFLDIVREAPDGDIAVRVEDGIAHVAAGRASWDLRLVDGSDYPKMPDVVELDYKEVDRVRFVRTLADVRHVASKKRPSLQMVNITGNRVRASDGDRLHQVPFEDFPFEALSIPLKAVDVLVPLLRNTEQAKVQIADEPHRIVFRVGIETLITQKSNADFPDIEGSLLKPTLENTLVLKAKRDDLQAAVRRMRVMADDGSSAVLLSLAESVCEVRCRDSKGNLAFEALEVEWSTEPLDVAFNHQHLTDLLQASPEVVELRFGPNTKTKKTFVLMEAPEVLVVVKQMKTDLSS